MLGDVVDATAQEDEPPAPDIMDAESMIASAHKMMEAMMQKQSQEAQPLQVKSAEEMISSMNKQMMKMMAPHDPEKYADELLLKQLLAESGQADAEQYDLVTSGPSAGTM